MSWSWASLRCMLFVGCMVAVTVSSKERECPEQAEVIFDLKEQLAMVQLSHGLISGDLNQTLNQMAPNPARCADATNLGSLNCSKTDTNCPDDIILGNGKLPTAYGKCNIATSFYQLDMVTQICAPNPDDLDTENEWNTAWSLPGEMSIVTKGGFWHPDGTNRNVIAHAFKRLLCNATSEECHTFSVGNCIKCPRYKTNGNTFNRGNGNWGTQNGHIFKDDSQSHAMGEGTTMGQIRLAVRHAVKDCLQEAYDGNTLKTTPLNYTCSAEELAVYRAGFEAF